MLMMRSDGDERRDGMLRLAVISAQRARLTRGTPAWRAKLREEERLLARIRVLARRATNPVEPSISLDDDLGFALLDDEIEEAELEIKEVVPDALDGKSRTATDDKSGAALDDKVAELDDAVDGETVTEMDATSDDGQQYGG